MTDNRTTTAKSLPSINLKLRVQTSATSRGFTLTEVLVVITIMGVLVFLSIPALQSARRASMITKSSSNLRQLALANFNYANDHDGFYFPFLRLNDSGEPDYNYPWMVDPKVTTYFGTPNPGWTSKEWPEMAKSGFNVTPSPDLGPGTMSIGYNWTDFWQGLNLRSSGRNQLRQTDIEQPTKLIMFAEATDFIMIYGKRNYWQPEHDTDTNSLGESAIAYRANGRTIVVTYAANIELLTREEVDNRARWFAKP